MDVDPHLGIGTKSTLWAWEIIIEKLRGGLSKAHKARGGNRFCPICQTTNKGNLTPVDKSRSDAMHQPRMKDSMPGLPRTSLRAFVPPCETFFNVAQFALKHEASVRSH